MITSEPLAPIASPLESARPGGWTSRFAPLATPAFDAWFASELAALGDDVASTIGPSFRGLVLGGGYGRGEGGIVTRSGVERPYNDIDLFLFVDRPRTVPSDALGAISARYHQRLGVEVDFSRPYRPSDIVSWRPTLMWHELAAGHVVLNGPDTLVSHRCPPHVRDAPPATEALLLLLNRGAGLLWAMRVARGCEQAPDEDFVRRNYYKCLLGCGDALLIAHRAYARSFAERGDRLRALPALPLMANRAALLDGYATARDFKRAPDTLDPAAPAMGTLMQAAELWADALLAVERVRTGRAWPSLSAYTAWSGSREAAAASVADRLRRLAGNLRAGHVAVQHPREPLYRALPGLLTLARPRGTEWPQASAQFLARWRAAQ